MQSHPAGPHFSGRPASDARQHSRHRWLGWFGPGVVAEEDGAHPPTGGPRQQRHQPSVRRDARRQWWQRRSGQSVGSPDGPTGPRAQHSRTSRLEGRL